MKGFHAEDAALHSGVFSLHSAPTNLVGHQLAMFPPHPKREDLSDLAGYLQIFSPSQAPGAAEEAPPRKLPEYIYGDFLDPAVEISALNINTHGGMISPDADKQTGTGKRSCEGFCLMEGDSKSEEESICTSGAMSDTFSADGCAEEEDYALDSMAATVRGGSFDLAGGLKAGSRCSSQGSLEVPIAAGSSPMQEMEHSLRSRGLYMDVLRASLAALACEASPGDKALWRLLHSNQEGYGTDLLCSDEFCMYEFKVRRCMRGRSHDWTECPYAHPGEKARRRDPRCYNYSGTACPDYRKGACRKGDSCDLSHGVFECWLHPARYRTQFCKDGRACKRRVCFFAHSSLQLRIVSPAPLARDEHLPFGTAAIACSEDGRIDTSHHSPPFSPTQLSTARLLDDFRPQTVSGFHIDQARDALSPLASQTHGSEHNTINHGGLENYARRNSHLQLADLAAQLEMISNQDRARCYLYAADGQNDFDNLAFECRKEDDYCGRLSRHSSALETPNLKSEASLRNHLALAGLKGSLDHLMSPTSTLVGHHVFSPPPLSPPLSPVESPPTSPGSPFSTWNCVLPRKLASLAGHHSYDTFPQNLTIGGDAAHVSTISNYLPKTTHKSSVQTSMYGPSPLSVICDGDQMRDCNGLDAFQKGSTMNNGVAEKPMDSNARSQGIADVILKLKELRCAGMVEMKSRRKSPPLLQRLQSPKPGREKDYCCMRAPVSLLMHDSDLESSTKLNGMLPTEERDNPDFGWVNELVN